MLLKNSKLILLISFFLAIFIPGALLGFLALRAIDREEAYIEKGLKSTLLAEVTHTVTMINNELEKIQEELAAIIEFPEGSYSESLSAIKQESTLIDIPFLVSSQREILWPNKNKQLTEEESVFVASNEELFEDEIEIPVYKNVVIEYREQIINEPLDTEQESNNQKEIDNSDINTDEQEIIKQQMESPDIQENTQAQEEAVNQEAFSRFEQSEPLRSKIYSQAVEEGQEVVTRNIIVPEGNTATLGEQWSFFILESYNFSQIIEEADSGIIPRFIQDELMLLYWEKGEQGDIVGCVIRADTLKQRLLQVMPPFYTETRLLVILDEKGIPIFASQSKNYPDWQSPLAAREISSILPRWEVAAYLTDPTIIETTAQSTALVLGILISFLLGFILIGGLIIVRLICSEIALAQQKTNFVANVSHELKTPLTSIRLFSEMLGNNRQPDKKKQKRYFDIMVSESERLTRLINNVLDFSKMGQKKRNYNKKRINVVDLCREITESQRTRLEHSGFTLCFKSSGKKIFINTDEEALKQVLINLLSNAEKYSQAKKKIEIQVKKADKKIKIKVKDRGPGIPCGKVKKIFKEFYRLDDSLTARIRGSGLGLTISRRLIRDQGGDVKYIPRKGGGSVFEISFSQE